MKLLRKTLQETDTGNDSLNQSPMSQETATGSHKQDWAEKSRGCEGNSPQWEQTAHSTGQLLIREKINIQNKSRSQKTLTAKEQGIQSPNADWVEKCERTLLKRSISSQQFQKQVHFLATREIQIKICRDPISCQLKQLTSRKHS